MQQLQTGARSLTGLKMFQPLPVPVAATRVNQSKQPNTEHTDMICFTLTAVNVSLGASHRFLIKYFLWTVGGWRGAVVKAGAVAVKVCVGVRCSHCLCGVPSIQIAVAAELRQCDSSTPVDCSRPGSRQTSLSKHEAVWFARCPSCSAARYHPDSSGNHGSGHLRNLRLAA